ncbi:MAG: tetratricopeptide repeat protein [Rhodobiaceae bacterium]|nr:tetratricopeptide repeat protein [Rhodobiaceae bacterium]
MFADPTNIEINLTYLQQQLGGGNFKGAAATLQRILLLDPSSKLAKVLYAEVQLKLGNRADARLILQQLLADKSLSAAMRNKALELKEALERSERRLSISGSAGLAGGSADNALAAPKGPIMLFNNQPIANTSKEVTEAFIDYDGMVSLSYKLPTYRERTLTTAFGAAGRDYLDQNTADSLTGFVSFGYSEKRKLPFKFNYSAYATDVSGHPYNAGQQGVFGLSVDLPQNANLQTSLRVGETRHFKYLGSSAGKQRDNETLGVSATYLRPIAGLSIPLLVSTSLLGDKSSAEIKHFSAQSVSAVVGLRTRLARVNVSLSLDFLVTEYEGANTLISTQIRQDERTRLTASLGYKLPPHLGAIDLALSGFAADTRSNIPNSTRTLSELKLSLRRNF